ncbi:MAG TPA: hypothetical protein VK447_20695 [Myxococcaceae bacterium]|nr:hypothetical protein [Myxococcaceae bacterium]
MRASVEESRSPRLGPRLWRGLGALVFVGTVVAWVVHLVRAAHPASGVVVPFHSDNAIPVLMANDPRWTPFSLYFYGMDRFGAWPFLLARLVRAGFGVDWSPPSLATCAALFVCAGAVPLSRLLRGHPRFAAVGLFAWLAVSPNLRRHLFELAQVYPWQLPMLLWAWWALRRLAAPGRGRVGTFAFALLPAALAVWSSPLSGPLLAGIAVGESTLRPSGERESPRARGTVALRCVGVAALAMAFERLLRAWFHRYAAGEFGVPYATNLSLSPRLLPGAVQAYGSYLWREEPFILLGLGAAVVGLMGARLRAKAPGGRSLHSSERVAVISLGLAGLASVAAGASAHVRDNLHDPRYLTPSCFFVAVAVLAVAELWAERWRLPASGGGAVGAAALAAGTAVLLFALPGRPRDPGYGKLVEAARAMEGQGGPIHLLGGYLGTYVFASLASPGALLPVPVHGQYVRTPWMLGPGRPGESVLVTDYRYDGGFGAPDHPPDAWLYDRERVYLQAPGSRWSNGTVSFWRYRLGATVPVTPSEPIDGWQPGGVEPLLLPVTPGTGSSLLLFLEARGGGAPRVEVRSEEGLSVPLAVEEQGARFVRYRLPPGDAPVWLEVRSPTRLLGAVVVRPRDAGPG